MEVPVVTVVSMMTMIERTIITAVIVVTEEIHTEIKINITAESMIHIPVDGMITIIIEVFKTNVQIMVIHVLHMMK